MKTSDRIFLFTLGLINITLGICFVYLRLFSECLSFLDDLITFDSLIVTFFVIVFSLILFAVGTSLFVIACNSLKYKRIHLADTVTLEQSPNGTSEITFAAIRNIAKRRCLTNRSVMECNTEVEKQDNGIALQISIKPIINAEIPNVISQLKSDLTEAVSAQTGLNVNSVSILVQPSVANKTNK